MKKQIYMCLNKVIIYYKSYMCLNKVIIYYKGQGVSAMIGLNVCIYLIQMMISMSRLPEPHSA